MSKENCSLPYNADCTGTVKRQNVKKHLDTCKFTVVACKYQRLEMIWNNMNVTTTHGTGHNYHDGKRMLFKFLKSCSCSF